MCYVCMFFVVIPTFFPQNLDYFRGKDALYQHVVITNPAILEPWPMLWQLLYDAGWRVVDSPIHCYYLAFAHSYLYSTDDNNSRSNQIRVKSKQQQQQHQKPVLNPSDANFLLPGIHLFHSKFSVMRYISR